MTTGVSSTDATLPVRLDVHPNFIDGMKTTAAGDQLLMPANNSKTRVNENGRQINRSRRDRSKVIEMPTKRIPCRTVQIPMVRQKMAYQWLQSDVHPTDLGKQYGHIGTYEANRIVKAEVRKMLHMTPPSEMRRAA